MTPPPDYMVNVEAEELAVDLEAVTEPSRRSDLERCG
jgi:hypothetical protein